MTRIRNQIHSHASLDNDLAVVRRPHLLTIPDVSRSHREPAVAAARLANVDAHRIADEVKTPSAAHQKSVAVKSARVREIWEKQARRLAPLRVQLRASLAQRARSVSVSGSTLRWLKPVLIVVGIALLAFALAGVLGPNRAGKSADSDGISANPSADVRHIEHGAASPLRVNTTEVAGIGDSEPANSNIFHVPSIGGASVESQVDTTVESDRRPVRIDLSGSREPLRAGQHHDPLVDPRQTRPAVVATTNRGTRVGATGRQRPTFSKPAAEVIVDEHLRVATDSKQRKLPRRQEPKGDSTGYESTDPSKYRYPHYSVPSMVRRNTTER